MKTIRTILWGSVLFLSVQIASADPLPAPETGGTSTAGNNKTVVRRFYDEVWNKMKLETVDEIFLPPFDMGPMKDTVTAVHLGIPDIHFTLDEIFAAEDDRIVTSFTATGTHSSNLFGVAPTAKKIKLKGIEIFRFKDGKIYEKQSSDSRLLLMHQIGALCKQAAPQ